MKLSLLVITAALTAAPLVRADEVALVVDPAKSHVDANVNVTIDSFVARISNFDADIGIDTDFGNVTKANLHFKFTDLKTGDDDRDREMYDWEQVAKFPEGSFALTAVTPSVDGQFRANGKLKLHGTEKPVSFLFTVSISKKIFTVDGEATLDTREFGLPVYRRLIFLTVDPMVQVQFHLVGKLAAQ